MKYIVTNIMFSCLIGSVCLTNCKSPSEKLENAQNNVYEANKDLDIAHQEYLNDIENYRKETAYKIATNEKSIAEFNVRIAKGKKAVKAEYLKKIAELEKRNTDIKRKIDTYNAEGKENWEKFKLEFGHDMDELGKAFKGLTVNSGK